MLRRAWIRTDSSVQIGGGHLMRCLALADELRLQGVEVSFLCRQLPGNLAHLVAAKGHRVVWIAQCSNRVANRDYQQADAAACSELVNAMPNDWLIVDHYKLSSAWESAMRTKFHRLLVIDDLADREHDCDLLVDQNRSSEQIKDYEGLIGASCRPLMGPRYALLARQFAERRKMAVRRSGRLCHLLIFFGASDENNYTRIALDAVSLWGRNATVTVVLGGGNPHRKDIEAHCAHLESTRLFVETLQMARIMAEADCAIGAAGSATWERCCVGLPSLVTIYSPDQAVVAATVCGQGAAYFMGQAETLTAQLISNRLDALSPQDLADMEERAFSLVDGQGSTRVVEEMLS